RNTCIEQLLPFGEDGAPAVPRARDVPTLASLRTLDIYVARVSDRSAVSAGLAFMRRQAIHWIGPLPDDLPVGIELLLPHLLEEAALVGLNVAEAPYAPLIELGNRRRQLIARRRLIAGTTPVHSWEAFGVDPDPALIDGSGGIGHSPAATAAWLYATSGHSGLEKYHAAGRRYLEQASAVTGVGIPGVVP